MSINDGSPLLSRKLPPIPPSDLCCAIWGIQFSVWQDAESNDFRIHFDFRNAQNTRGTDTPRFCNMGNDDADEENNA